jgi:hypothetical protein
VGGVGGRERGGGGVEGYNFPSPPVDLGPRPSSLAQNPPPPGEGEFLVPAPSAAAAPVFTGKLGAKNWC